MISAFSRLQGPFAITVYAPEDRRGFWDIARDRRLAACHVAHVAADVNRLACGLQHLLSCSTVR